MNSVPSTVAGLAEQLRRVRTEAENFASNTPESIAVWRPGPSSWTIAECFEHLALFNRTYLKAMTLALQSAEPTEPNQTRARPGIFGRMFVGSMEPPARAYTKTKASGTTTPATGLSLAVAFADFFDSHQQIEGLLETSQQFSLEKIKFANPFLKGLRPRLATGFHILAVHERRHLWQASVLRRQAEQARC